MKTIIERGASWTLEETKLLLAIWGQDYVQRKQTNIKRTKEVYEKISERFTQDGYERTAEQVRTRIFNMIAEYRRILKDGSPERQKKCIFFEALHKIYQAKHVDDIKLALDEYEPEYPYSPASTTHAHSSEKGDESVSDSEATDGNETMNSTLPTTNNTNNTSTTNNSIAATGSSVTSSSSNSNTNNNQQSDNNNHGDSNNTNNIEKESSPANNSHSANKRVKLEPPKSAAQNQASNQASVSASTSSSNSTDHQANTAKHNNKSSTAPTVATSTMSPTPVASSSSSSTTSSSQRHQSLLLPHATTSSSTATTPISKLTATSGTNSTPSYININSTKLPIIRANQLIGHPNGNESLNLNGTATRLPTTAAITSHQLYQAPVNTFDVTSSALLIDRMFAHLSRESENAREWIALEKERLALEKTRRQQEAEREIRRERVLIDTLMRFQESWLSFLARLDPQLVENAGEPVPQLRFPPKDPSSSDTTLNNTQSSVTQNSTNSIPPSDSNKI